MDTMTFIVVLLMTPRIVFAGLVAEGEKPQKQTGGLVVTKDLMGNVYRQCSNIMYCGINMIIVLFSHCRLFPVLIIIIMMKDWCL